ncbi:hypothetical protein V7S43_010963 [Phytophthora oleae]|uniref:Helicase-associated domain-containing protein n=1 Tax=Phytophthora oleae TaxID=2107226 RepID=A0ABD3FBG8_9STRA
MPKNLLAALRVYKELEGGAPSTKFVVSSGDNRWPQELWGYLLGKQVNRLRFNLRHKGYKLSPETEDMLSELGFDKRSVSQIS